MATVGVVTIPANTARGLFAELGVTPALSEIRYASTNRSVLAAVTDADGEDRFDVEGGGSIITSEEFFLLNTSNEDINVKVLIIKR